MNHSKMWASRWTLSSSTKVTTIKNSTPSLYTRSLKKVTSKASCLRSNSPNSRKRRNFTSCVAGFTSRWNASSRTWGSWTRKTRATLNPWRKRLNGAKIWCNQHFVWASQNHRISPRKIPANSVKIRLGISRRKWSRCNYFNRNRSVLSYCAPLRPNLRK